MKKGIHSYKAQAKWLNKQLEVELKKKKKIAREKGKAPGVEKSEQDPEVSKKRKGIDEMFFITDGRVQKHLCEGKHEGVKFFFAETAVTAEQHCLDQ